MAVPKGTRIGGRQKGTPNKNTAEVRDIARKHGPDAIKVLVKLMNGAEAEAARIAAANSILDRAYGRPTQSVEGSLTLNHTAADAAFADLIDTLDVAARTATAGLSGAVEVVTNGAAKSTHH